MALQDKLDALKTKFETEMAPPEVVAVMHRVTDELIASGQADRALHAGDRAPAFSLPDPDGKLVSSQELLAKGPLVLTFYRGAWCPFCNLDLQALEEARSEIETRGASLVAVSQQTAANSRKAQRNNKLGFPIVGTGAANWPRRSESAGNSRKTCKRSRRSSAPTWLPSMAKIAGLYRCRLDT
jgi:hypothetical protein